MKAKIVVLLTILCASSALAFAPGDTVHYHAYDIDTVIARVLRSVSASGVVNTTQRVYNVLAYGAVANDSTVDNWTAFEAAAIAAAGQVLYAPKGTYWVHSRVSGAHSTISSICLRAGTTFVGDGEGLTVIRRLNTGLANDYIIANYNTGYDGTGDSGIVVMNMTLDGGRLDHSLTASTAQFGIVMANVKDPRIENVLIRNIRGTTNGNGGESFSLTFNQCFQPRATNCIAEGDTLSSTGFSLNGSVGGVLTGCRAYNFIGTYPNQGAGGFTQYGCRNITYIGCAAWGNRYSGFNNENSSNTSYIRCVSGLKIDSSSVNSAWDGAYPYAAGSTSPNYHGFIVGSNVDVDSTSVVSFIDCVSEYNNAFGIYISNPRTVQIIGGRIDNNVFDGIRASDSATTILIMGAVMSKNNGPTYWSDVWTAEGHFLVPPGTPYFSRSAANKSSAPTITSITGKDTSSYTLSGGLIGIGSVGSGDDFMRMADSAGATSGNFWTGWAHTPVDQIVGLRAYAIQKDTAISSWQHTKLRLTSFVSELPSRTTFRNNDAYGNQIWFDLENDSSYFSFGLGVNPRAIWFDLAAKNVISRNLMLMNAGADTAASLSQVRARTTTLKGNYSGTGTRLALYAPGVTTASHAVASPSGTDTAPNIHDIWKVYVKTDSVIVNRDTSGTSGLEMTVNVVQ